jgi:hypothetical protein
MKKIKFSVLFAAIGLLGLSSVSSVRAGLVGHWVADDWTGGSNNWLDRVASKVATANGAATIVSSAFSGGTATKGIVFDGVDDFFEVSSANSPVGGKNAMTVVALFKATQGATGSDGAFWQYPGPVNSEGPGTPNDFGITYNAAGEANGFFNQAVSLSSTVSVIDGSPHTMILTWRSVEGGGDEIARLYVDGVLAGSTSATDGAAGQVHTSAIRFGRDIENARWFRGTVGEIRFYDSIENAATLHSALVTPVPEIGVKGRNTSIASGDTTPSAADGTDFGTVMTGGSSVTSTFVVTNAGNAALNFTGSPKVNITGAGAAHFSLLTGAFSGLTVDNASFETPVQSSGGFTYGPTGTGGWVFGGEAGIARNSSPWYINPAPDGNQAAYIQSNGSGAYFYQNINFPSAGAYVISFDIVRRNASYEGNDIDVRMDGVSIGSVSNTQQTTDNWATFTFTYNCPSAGNHELRFVGTRANDRDSAIDRVRVDHSSVFLAANGSTSFQVKYAPSSAGTHAATVTIQNDDSDEGAYTFALQGTAVASGTSQTWNADTGNGNGSGNTTADGLRIRRNGGNIEFSADGGTTWSASTVYSTTTVLTLTGSGADDTFVIDFSGGNPIPSGGITITGSGQATSGDGILLTGGSHTTVTYGFLNNNDGSIDIDGDVINYTGLEPITDNSDAVNRVFDFNGGAETVTATSASATQTKVDSTLGESVTFNNPTATLTINAGTGDDTVLLYRLSTGWGAATVTINGGADDDIIQLNKTVATAAAITVNGDAHTTGDVLNFDREGDATIVKSGMSPGTVTGGSPAIQTVNYDTVETSNVHLLGSIGDAVVADRGPYFSTGTILLHKAASGTQVVVDTTIKDPYEIDVDATGKFVIADYEVNAGTAGIYSIDRFAGTKATVSSAGDLEVPFGVKVAKAGPHSGKYIVADLDADNNGAAEWGAIFVVDPGAASPGNQTLLSSRTTGTGTDFYWLTGLALGSAGDIYVCDQGNQASPGTQPPRIYHVDPATGNRTIMAEGGTMKQPAGLAVISGTGATAELVVVDAGLKKLLRFTGTGAPIAITAGEELGHTGVTFDKPTHVAIDGSGDYVITDAPVGAVAGQRRVHRMNSGTLVTTTITTDGFLEQPRGAVVVP